MTWDNKRDVGRMTGRPWRRLRDQILLRDKFLCQPCRRAGRPTVANQVDHILALARGGTDQVDNLESICDKCHRVKSQAESRGQSPKVQIGVDGFPVSARVANRNETGSHWNR